MSVFGGLILTNKGRNLLIKSQLGAVINYTRIAVGDGSLSGSSILDLNALKNEVKTFTITKLKSLTGGRFVVGTTFSNNDITSGFYYRELGLFAQDPDHGEILYCYANAGALAEYIAAGGGADLIEKAIDLEVVLSNASSVTATIDSSLVYASYTDLENKVDKITGKGLSSNDYTTVEKNKLSGVEVNANNYAHPSTHPSTIIKMADNKTLEEYKSDVVTQLTEIVTKTPSPAQYYVDNTNGNDNNDGLTKLTAFKSIQKAWNVIPIFINYNYVIKIVGEYHGDVVLGCKIVKEYYNYVHIIGDTTTPANQTFKDQFYVTCLIGATNSIRFQYLKFDKGITFSSSQSVDMINCESTNAVRCNYSTIYISMCVINSISMGINSYMSRVNSSSNTGNCATYGLYVSTTGTIGKTGTQPTGTAANEYTANGGVIR